MNALQRRRWRRSGERFIARLVDALRPLEGKIVNDPEGARKDFREIIEGADAMYRRHEERNGNG